MASLTIDFRYVLFIAGCKVVGWGKVGDTELPIDVLVGVSVTVEKGKSMKVITPKPVGTPSKNMQPEGRAGRCASEKDTIGFGFASD